MFLLYVAVGWLAITSKIPALRAGILLGISYRIQIGLAYCNGPKGAGRGSEKPTCRPTICLRLGNPGAAGPDRLYSVREAGRYKVALNRCAGSTAG